MREVLFSAGSVFVFILVCSVIAFNPLTTRAQMELVQAEAPPQLPLSEQGILTAAIDNAVDEFILSDLRVRAVCTEMFGVLGWFYEDKEAIQETSFQAIKDLEDIKTDFALVRAPDILKEPQKSYITIVTKLQDIYDKIDLKSTEEALEDFNKFKDMRRELIDKVEKIQETYAPEVEWPENYSLQEEELKLARDEKDRQAYLNALGLIDERKCQAAYSILDKLHERYIGSPFEVCIKLRKTDCLLVADSDIEVKEGEDYTEYTLNILEELTDSRRYSPILYETYYKWRTEYQSYNHGMSNMSAIPNKEYNEKRYQVLLVLKDYLKLNPQDLGAKLQIALLLSLPNITRGGTFGNGNIYHWAYLYTNILDSDTE